MRRRVRKGGFRGRGRVFFFSSSFSILSKFPENKTDALDPVGPHLDAADPPREHVEEHGDLESDRRRERGRRGEMNKKQKDGDDDSDDSGGGGLLFLNRRQHFLRQLSAHLRADEQRREPVLRNVGHARLALERRGVELGHWPPREGERKEREKERERTSSKKMKNETKLISRCSLFFDRKKENKTVET